MFKQTHVTPIPNIKNPHIFEIILKILSEAVLGSTTPTLLGSISIRFVCTVMCYIRKINASNPLFISAGSLCYLLISAL